MRRFQTYITCAAPKQPAAGHRYTLEGYKAMSDWVLGMLQAAALVLTINLALITTSVQPQVLGGIKWQIGISSVLLIISLLFGAFTISGVIQLLSGKGSESTVEILAPIQLYSFMLGLILMLWAVLVRVGVA